MFYDFLSPGPPFPNAKAAQNGSEQGNEILSVCPHIGIGGERRVGIYVTIRSEEMEDSEAEAKYGGP